MILSWGQQARPVGLSTLEQVQELRDQAAAAAGTAATDAFEAAQPQIAQAAQSAADQAAVAIAPAAADAIRAQVATDADRAEAAADQTVAALPGLNAQIAAMNVRIATMAVFGPHDEHRRFLAQKFGYGGSGQSIALLPVAEPTFTNAEGLQFYLDYLPLTPQERHAAALAFWSGLYRERYANACGSRWFEERLVGFWQDHFTTSFGPGLPLTGLYAGMVDDAIRQNIGKTFNDLLQAAELHPSMLTYLNQNISAGNNSPVAIRRNGTIGLNENLGRELLELHTIGVNATYTQTDVREAANVLTGCRFERGDGGFFYDPRWAEPGTQVVLGIEYPENTLAEVRRMLRDLALNPQTAAHLSWKLAVHFVSDTPPQSLIDRMTATYIDTGGYLPAVYADMMSASETLAAGHTKARQPQDWVPACFRAVGMTPAEVRSLTDDDFRSLVWSPIETMGQTIFGPIGPNGWPEEASAWVQPQLLPVRIEWARNTLPLILATVGRPLPTLDEVLFNAFGDDVPDQVAQWAPMGQDIEMSIAAVLTSAEFMSR